MSPLGLTPTHRDAAGSLLGAQVPLREAQEALVGRGEKKNAVKQAALTLKKLFEV